MLFPSKEQKDIARMWLRLTTQDYTMFIIGPAWAILEGLGVILCPKVVGQFGHPKNAQFHFS